VRTGIEELEILRRAYAKQVMAAAGVDDPRVEAAFVAVRREDLLGHSLWSIVRWSRGYGNPRWTLQRVDTDLI